MNKKEKRTEIPESTTTHLMEIISEEEFLRLVQNAASDVLRLSLFLEDLKSNEKVFNKKLFYAILTVSRDLEDFLDAHGAKNNREWSYFRELVASARNFGFAAFLIEHIEKSHIPPEEQKIFDEYFDKTKNTKHYFNQTLLKIFELIRVEAQRLKISFPPRGLTEIYYYDIPSNKFLPQNLDEGEVKNKRENIIKICSKYLNISSQFHDLRCNKQYPSEILSQMIPEKINEEKIRRFELVMHNLESVYDTYVKDKALENEDSRFGRLRTYISSILHLFEIARVLAHFYERHEKINRILEKSITQNNILNCTINWALYYINLMMLSGRMLADELLKEYTAMDSIELPVPKDLGFHLRPSTLVAKVVNHYGSDVYMVVGQDKFDAKSVLSLTWAGGKIAREKIEKVTFVGDKRVLKDLKILASVNYGEDIMGKDRPLPKVLSYLR
ncbi:MAG TPA: HPr family phosphocarrier protein [Thermodesulfobacteriota bacterium]|nr:HPr family phosphocarrier protein [Thermodesulfobacteriota bacterium]